MNPRYLRLVHMLAAPLLVTIVYVSGCPRDRDGFTLKVKIGAVRIVATTCS